MSLAPPTILAQASPSLRMSEQDFVAWAGEDCNAEWVAGEVELKMSNHEVHDLLQRAIAASLEEFVARRSLGKVRGPQFTMRLPQKPSRRDPDVMFVATENESRLGPTVLEGPCDVAIEIVSPDSVARDYREKFLEYQAAGVAEYWIVDPLARTITAHQLVNGDYVATSIDAGGRFHSTAIAGWWLRAADLFRETPPRSLELMRLLGIE